MFPPNTLIGTILRIQRSHQFLSFSFFVRRIRYIVRILVISRREGSRSFKRHNAEQILPRSSWIPSHVVQPLGL